MDKIAIDFNERSKKMFFIDLINEKVLHAASFNSSDGVKELMQITEAFFLDLENPPSVIFTDNSYFFYTGSFKLLLNELNIQHKKAPYHVYTLTERLISNYNK